MRARLLEYLVCPLCRAPLTLDSGSNMDHPDAYVRSGELRCSSCADTYVVRDGIPRFPLATKTSARRAVLRTRQAYDFTWSHFGAAEIEDRWEKDSYAYMLLIPERFFLGSGKIGLDAGCGGGADLVRFWQRGVRVIGFDLSSGVDTIARTTEMPPHGELVQGDLYLLPFQESSFDFIYSFGVLHHLPDPASGLAALTRVLRPGAPIATYLYETFDGRSRLARTILRFVRQVRRVTACMPPRLLHLLCWSLVPFVWMLFAVPARLFLVFGGRLAGRLPFAHTLRWPVLAADLFDRFAPPVEHRFTEGAVRELYARCGLERVEVYRYRGWVSWGFKPVGPDSEGRQCPR